MFARSLAPCASIIIATALAAPGGGSALRANGGVSAAEAQPLGPGMWEIATRIDHLAIPGLPEPMVRKIAADPANATPRKVCIATKAGSQPPAAVFHGLNGACRYETWQAEAGSLRAVLTCYPPDGGAGEARVEVSGNYSGSAFEVTSETIARDEAGATQMHMRSVLSGKLTSPDNGCTAPDG